MKPFCLLLCLALISPIGRAQSSDPVTPVASSGETAVRGKVGKDTVVVFIKTHEVPIGQPTDVRPPDIESNCTYSKYPCSIVDRVKILEWKSALRSSIRIQ
jgi:hypothetical protein